MLQIYYVNVPAPGSSAYPNSMSVIVRCPVCQQRSRVAEGALGLVVACPRCPHQFTATSDEELIIAAAAPIPTVHPRQRLETPRATPAIIPDDHPVHVGPNAFLIAVALLPLGIPLMWLLVGAITGRETVLSFAAPVSIAVGVCGLCAGIALTHWGTPARIRAMLAVVLLAYLAAGALYFLKPAWLEEARKNFGRGELAQYEFGPPDKAYTVKFPGRPKEQDNSPVEGWALKAFRFADPARAGSDVFISAHGSAPKDFPKDGAEEAWFKKAKEALLQTSGAALVKEEPILGKGYEAREYELQLPDDQIKRVVRIVRVKGRVFYLSVDGPFLTGDTPDVKEFMKSFTLLPKPKP